MPIELAPLPPPPQDILERALLRAEELAKEIERRKKEQQGIRIRIDSTQRNLQGLHEKHPKLKEQFPEADPTDVFHSHEKSRARQIADAAVTVKAKGKLRSFLQEGAIYQREHLALIETVRWLQKLLNIETSSEKAYQFCTKAQDESNTFLGERDLISNVLGDKAEVQLVQDALSRQLPEHGLTGFSNPMRTPVALALAHDYALRTGKPMTAVFGDISNIAGTNTFFDDLLLSEIIRGFQDHLADDSKKIFSSPVWGALGFSQTQTDRIETDIIAIRDSLKDNGALLGLLTDDIRKQASMMLTDWCSRVMMSKIKNAFEKQMDEDAYKQVQFLGMGGDEFYITSPQDRDSIVAILEQAKEDIEAFITRAGLNDYQHSKPEKADKHGLGLGFTVTPLNDTRVEDMASKKQDLYTEAKKESAYQFNTPNEIANFNNYQSVHEQKRTRLTRIAETLSGYTDLKPEANSAANINDLLITSSEKLNPNALDVEKIKFRIRRQLFSMYNPNTGTQHIDALPLYLKQGKLGSGELKVVSVSLENIAAINDRTTMDKGDEILKLFASAFTDALTPYTSNSNKPEIFMAGPGKFFVVISSQVDQNQLEIKLNGIADTLVNELNETKVQTSIGENVKVGSLPSPKRDWDKGLYQCTAVESFDSNKDDIKYAVDQLVAKQNVNVWQLRLNRDNQFNTGASS